MPEDLKKQYQNYTCADMTKLIALRKSLGFDSTCQYSVKEGVSDYIKNYLVKDARW